MRRFKKITVSVFTGGAFLKMAYFFPLNRLRNVTDCVSNPIGNEDLGIDVGVIQVDPAVGQAVFGR
ncbi:hypothetical protein [Schleiferilactobacillus harbinensis]|uniref:hypothetical protein n=1 Tax=Schleiferilactobacillus harbinensis TaxID=304207 RepID=UPI00186AEE57|nr:hypothetical protein [Schleiferilactobacillus harbinensis]